MRENLDKTSLEISEALPAFYVPYASYVIQSRALPDARDGLKAGARFILYAQYKNKITYKDKRRKGTATKSAAMMFSPHGDAAIYETAVRMSQDFSMRYPLMDTHGNNGSIMHNNDYAADRYLEMRGGEIALEMTSLLQKETVDKWKLNYTEEEYYPTYLPTTFPTLLVNGTYGIGVGIASSIPPHNLNDVSNAILTYIDNPSATFDELYCPIDFPTGGIIVNENEVKESLKTGKGTAAVVRSVVDYDDKNHELIVHEIPYMTFTASLTASIQAAIDENGIPGIDSVYDGTTETPEINIKLTKGANPERVLKLLFKHTPLQNYYSINMNALDNGCEPKQFGWVELVSTYVNHLKNVLRRSYEYDYKIIKDRLEILDGLITAILNIDDVVEIVKTSKSKQIAKDALIERFTLTERQVDAILVLKLSSLVNLELQKLKDEQAEKEKEAARLCGILNAEEKFNNEVKKEVIRIKEKYGDERRTKCINLDYKQKGDEIEPIEEKELLIYYTNLGNIFTQESTTLMRTRRGTKGTKIKLANNEVIENVISDTNIGNLLVFTNKGLMYHIATDELSTGVKTNLTQYFNFMPDEYITAITTYNIDYNNTYFIFITKNGMIKKTSSVEYNAQRRGAIKAINLNGDDEVITVLFVKDENVGLLTKQGNYVIIKTTDISAIGRAAKGIKAINLNADDCVIDAKTIKNSDKYMLSISKNGFIKKTSMNEFPVCNRGIKGKKISAIKDNDNVLKFLTFSEDCDIIIVSKRKTICFSTAEIKETSRISIGVKSINLDEQDNIRDVKKYIGGMT